MGFGDWQVLVSLAFYIGILGFAIAKMKEKGLLSFSIWFFLLTISLYCNIFVTIGTHMGERLLFFPSLGFCLFIAWALMKLFKQDAFSEGESLRLPAMLKSNTAMAGIVGVVLVAYSYKTYSIWNDSAVASHYAEALAHSMRLTKEIVAANVFHRGFDPSLLGEIEIEIDDHSKPLSRALLS